VTHEGQIVGLGFDAEPSTPLDTDLVSTICTPAEQRWIVSHPAPGTCGWAKVIFSAKEAVHKCIWPACHIALEFEDVEVAVPGAGQLAVRLSGRRRPGLPDFARLEGWYVLRGSHILTGFVLWRLASERRMV
jgi:4'-phosphopantetheinyl transferase EntD